MGSASKPRSALSAKTKAADLERIRNNQRRSRAKRKDYIAELEGKVRSYENPGTHAANDIEFQRLVNENKLLKRLLRSMGLGDEFLKAYERASAVAPEMSQATTIEDNDDGCCRSEGCPASPKMRANPIPIDTSARQPNSPFQDSELGLEVSMQSFTHTNTNQSHNALQWGSYQSLDPSGDLSSVASIQTQTQYHDPLQPAAEQSISHASPNGLPPENTTLCSIALSLVMTNNLKGYSATALDLKLRPGYRCGASMSEGCRIDNKILFSVLAEIV